MSVLDVLLLGLLSANPGRRQLWRTAVEAALTTGSVLLIVASASLFSWIIAIERGPDMLTALLPGRPRIRWSFC